jgi:hypothetical protein
MGAADSDQRLSVLEGGQHLAKALDAGNGIELVDLGQPRGGVDIVVRAESDDQVVGLVGC